MKVFFLERVFKIRKWISSMGNNSVESKFGNNYQRANDQSLICVEQPQRNIEHRDGRRPHHWVTPSLGKEGQTGS